MALENRIAVVYQSKYGATKRYAEWISEELSADLYERKNIVPADLEQYDTIIYGGGLYAGGVSGIDLLTKNFKQFNYKRLILFTCGLADPENQENVDHIRAGLNKVLSPEMQEKIKIYHLRGSMDYAKLGVVHKGMMAMLYKITNKKNPNSLDNENKEFLSTYGKSVDFTDRSMIQPIVDFIRNQTSK